MSLEQLEAKLNSLRQKYKKAGETDRLLIINQAKLLKWGLEKLGTPFEVAKRIFEWFLGIKRCFLPQIPL